MAISSDKQLRKDLEERRASPVPARTLPGYIPGMPRPMTPRDTDSDDQRSYSTTPRATSPTNFTFPNRNESASPTFSSSVMSSYARREAAGSVRHSPAPTSSFSSTPLFLQRSPNGRHTPDDSRMDIAIDFDQSLNASILGRRRAASPMSSSYSTSMGSRPGTPSNSAAWPQPPSSPPQPRRGHSRNASWFTDETASDAHPTIDQVNVPMRSLKSPALPDSPLIDRGHAVMDSISSSQYSSDKRPASPMSGLELGAANPYTRVIRTPTPTEGPSRSPAFSNGGSPRSQRSSRQNGSIHNYNYSSFNNPLVFSPPASSSRSSLESTGSSYHSWEGDRNDNLSTLFNDSDAQPSWYDVSVSDQTSSITSAGFVEEEAEAILQAIGLKRADFMVIQEKLVEFANTKVSSSETTPQRSQSLRRRRPSTSQSNYSFNGRVRPTCWCVKPALINFIRSLVLRLKRQVLPRTLCSQQLSLSHLEKMTATHPRTLRPRPARIEPSLIFSSARRSLKRWCLLPLHTKTKPNLLHSKLKRIPRYPHHLISRYPIRKRVIHRHPNCPRLLKKRPNSSGRLNARPPLRCLL